MKFAPFVHLHTHTQYSLLDGANRIDDLIAKAVAYKMPALAMTDHGNMFGAIEFYKKATKAALKPIIGCEAYLAHGSRHDKKPSNKYPDGGFHLLLLAKNLTGYKNLMKLTSYGYLEGFYHRPRLDKELLRKHSEGLIATSACLQGEVNWHLMNGYTDEAVAYAREMEEIFGKGNFYLEIQNHGLELERQLVPKVIAVSKETGIPLIATNDCHYLNQEDWEAHDALVCIQTGKFISDTDRLRYGTDQIYFKSAEEMKQALGEYPQALENTLHIAESCNVELELGKLLLPQFPLPTPYKDADKFLFDKCMEGLKAHYGEPLSDVVIKRLDYELGVIRQMGYAGYFLIVKDFCDYARSQNIRVGPGRGSAAGSLVSYALGITSVDPIAFDLVFERFLNPERISMPDIDIDFADRGRDKIIEYVINKYGSDNVCQIITFGTMAARAVVRDVGRVLGVSYTEVDKIAKLIPLRVDMTLDVALKQVPELTQMAENDPVIDKLLRFSRTLEGLARHCSTHAAGVVIAPSALTNYVPLFKGSNDEITTQYDMKMVEEVGLLKMDFLGLRTLTVIDDSIRLIQETHPGVEINVDNLTLDDPKVYALFSRGETMGIFQFESPGMRDYLRRLKPETFTDITAMNALYRPGPLDSGMIDIYIERKKGGKITFLHPALEEILGSTYGVIVFQEQVLRIANSLAGYSMGKADLLRKAMGKKDAALMADQKKEFLAGTDHHKINRKVSEEVFNQIETFARYGFNKAHSTCYALVAYQTAWLKSHYPSEFMAASMSSEMNNSDRINDLLEECRKMRITVSAPDVNKSRADFSVHENKILFGLQAIKNVGEGLARKIVEERMKDGPFKDLGDLVSRVSVRVLNRRTLESLIAAGACDSLPGNRAQKYDAVESFLDFGQRVSQVTNTHDLFAGMESAPQHKAPLLIDIPEWSAADKLAKEKETLGFYISGHPLDKFRAELKQFTSTQIGNLINLADGREVTVGGIVSKIKTKLDKKEKWMAFVTLEGYTGSVELIVFSDNYEKNREILKADKMVLITGRLSTREEQTPKIVVSDVVALEKVAEHYDCQLVIKLEPERSDTLMQKVLEMLERYRGNTSVLFSARENGSEVYIKSKRYMVSPDFDMLHRLKEMVGESSAYLRPLQRK